MVLGEIGATLPAIDFALSKIQRIRDLSKANDNIELREAITDLREALVNVKDENIDLKQRIRDLESSIDQKQKLSLSNGVYWSGGEDIPYCQVCFERDNKLIHLHNFSGTSDYGSFYRCKVCGNDFDV
ncbi:MAG: hypothetical protein JAY90_23335 [Candidatus Thiodiazotropha lotti]|nr:hypothetical protein [Candidatus Thiodiazotropha lotti]